MNSSRPIIVIEDDMDDQELLKETFSLLKYPNPIIFFSNGVEALGCIENNHIKPVLIISDINMPKMSGFEIRKKIRDNKKLQNIPFVFLTTASQKSVVHEAYAVQVNGFFTKPNNVHELHEIVKTIVDYWTASCIPGEFMDIGPLLAKQSCSDN
jgi:CheY-like chemotaxis protein